MEGKENGDPSLVCGQGAAIRLHPQLIGHKHSTVCTTDKYNNMRACR